MLRPMVIAVAMAFAAQADAQVPTPVQTAAPARAADAVAARQPADEPSQIPEPASIALLEVALLIGGIVLGRNIEIR